MSRKKFSLKIALRLLALALVGAFLGGNIYLWNARSLTGNTLPMPFGFGAAVVLSGSMEPQICIDDLIFVRQQESYALNDVVVYQSSGALVVHRIIAVEGQLVTTKGDANNVDDGQIAVTLIKGRVVGHVPGVGKLVRLLKSPVVSVVLLAGAVFLLERSYRKEKKQDARQMESIKDEIRRLKEQIQTDVPSGEQEQ